MKITELIILNLPRMRSQFAVFVIWFQVVMAISKPQSLQASDACNNSSLKKNHRRPFQTKVALSLPERSAASSGRQQLPGVCLAWAKARITGVHSLECLGSFGVLLTKQIQTGFSSCTQQHAMLGGTCRAPARPGSDGQQTLSRRAG